MKRLILSTMLALTPAMAHAQDTMADRQTTLNDAAALADALNQVAQDAQSAADNSTDDYLTMALGDIQTSAAAAAQDVENSVVVTLEKNVSMAIAAGYFTRLDQRWQDLADSVNELDTLPPQLQADLDAAMALKDCVSADFGDGRGRDTSRDGGDHGGTTGGSTSGATGGTTGGTTGGSTGDVTGSVDGSTDGSTDSTSVTGGTVTTGSTGVVGTTGGDTSGVSGNLGSASGRSVILGL